MFNVWVISKLPLFNLHGEFFYIVKFFCGFFTRRVHWNDFFFLWNLEFLWKKPRKKNFFFFEKTNGIAWNLNFKMEWQPWNRVWNKVFLIKIRRKQMVGQYSDQGLGSKSGWLSFLIISESNNLNVSKY